MRGKFLDYAILGDDVVIANSKVAHEYLALMTSIGVGISLNKSVQPQSDVTQDTDLSGLEFARIYMSEGSVFEMMPLGLILDPSARSVFGIWDYLARNKTEFPGLRMAPNLGPSLPLSGKEGISDEWGFLSYYNLEKRLVNEGGLLAHLDRIEAQLRCKVSANAAAVLRDW